MDVSRIGAVSPTQVDWRKLTSKEIIEYEEQGVEVPSEYLKWAQDFQRTIAAEDTDDTTYEAASAAPVQTADNSTVPVDTESENDDSKTSSAEPVDNTPKTAAQSKREALEDAGVSLRTQARIFTNDSKSATKSVLESIVQISNAEEQSISEIQGLEEYMNALLAKAESTQNDLKSEVNKINNSDNDSSSFAKINKLQQQLERYGTEGQANIASAESDFSVYQATINGQSNAIFAAQDFGAETIGVGNDLLTSLKGAYIIKIVDFVIGRRAVKAGEKAVSWSEKTSEVQAQASQTNTDNISAANGYKGKVESKTGVAAAQNNKNANNGTEQNQEDKSEADKSVQTAQNDGTVASTKASASIDEILKAKIRKGEDINTQSA